MRYRFLASCMCPKKDIWGNLFPSVSLSPPLPPQPANLFLQSKDTEPHLSWDDDSLLKLFFVYGSFFCSFSEDKVGGVSHSSSPSVYLYLFSDFWARWSLCSPALKSSSIIQSGGKGKAEDPLKYSICFHSVATHWHWSCLKNGWPILLLLLLQLYYKFQSYFWSLLNLCSKQQ